MTNLVEKVNALALEYSFPYCRVHEISNNIWWATLIEHFGAEVIFNRLQQAQEQKQFDWADTHFYYDTEMDMIFSFNGKQQLRNHFNL